MEQGTLQIFYLKKKVLFPYCTLNVFIKETDETKEIKKGDKILAVTMRSILDLVWMRNRLATLSEVMEVQPDPGMMKIALKGISRARIIRINRHRRADYELLGPQKIDPHETKMETLRKKAQELIFLINVEESDKLIKLMNYIADPNQMTDFIASYFVMNYPARYRLYKEVDAKQRSLMLVSELSDLIAKLTKKRKKTDL